MVASLIIAGAAVVGGFIILRILMGSKSSYSSRHGAVTKTESQLGRMDRMEPKIKKLQAIISTSSDGRKREIAAKILERELKKREKMKMTAERSLKKA